MFLCPVFVSRINTDDLQACRAAHTHCDNVALAHRQQAIYMTRDLFTLLRVNAAPGRGTKHAAESKKKRQNKGRAFTVMLGEESTLMYANAAGEMEGCQ